jgi:hypothetical protein
MRRIVVVSFSILILCSLVGAQTLDWKGSWGGLIDGTTGQSGMELVLARDGQTWSSTLRLRIDGREFGPAVRDLVMKGDTVSFSADVAGNLAKFSGSFEGDTLTGMLDVIRNETRIGGGKFILMRGAEMPPPPPPTGGQMADPNFDATVAKPAYSKDGPKVLFDEAHNNFHTASGRYKPFAELIISDGYVVVPNREKFSAEGLKDYKVLVISNALGAAGMAEESAANPAFTEQESDAVRDWVKAGGSLLLIADHAPMGSANQILGSRFNVDMSKKYTRDPQNFEKESNNQGFIVYTRESGRLADHPITNGRNETERVNKIIAFTGQSLKGPADGKSIMSLADTAEDVMPGPDPKPVSAAGRSQGLALTVGKGRVVILGEAGMLSAQVVGPNKVPFGMNRPGIDNRQFALNIMHWLTGLL